MCHCFVNFNVITTKCLHNNIGIYNSDPRMFDCHKFVIYNIIMYLIHVIHVFHAFHYYYVIKIMLLHSSVSLN